MNTVVHRHRNHLLTSVDDEKKKNTCGTVKCTGLVVSHVSARQLFTEHPGMLGMSFAKTLGHLMAQLLAH